MKLETKHTAPLPDWELVEINKINKNGKVAILEIYKDTDGKFHGILQLIDIPKEVN